MIRNSLIVFFLGSSLGVSLAQAGSFKILARDGTVILNQEIAWEIDSNVGKVTVAALTQAQRENKLTFVGDESGLLSVNGVGNAMEVISDKEMKAYGWCFNVDQVSPDTMPSETRLKSGHEKIVWYYAFAHYLNGNWISMCERDAPGR